ncbi:hypothetical protein D5086_021175 [Populus alba]|uniref:Uncharacterized protein n=1 Tax=Populus alba TaxID=43335 RepID=A0ACC4BBE2_POPAL
MSHLSVLLQEPEREAQTFLALLRDHMKGTADYSRRRLRMSLKERLGLKGLGCCGATWVSGPPPSPMMTLIMNKKRVCYPVCLDPTQQYSSGMNLAAALEIISWSPPMLLMIAQAQAPIKHT